MIHQNIRKLLFMIAALMALSACWQDLLIVPFDDSGEAVAFGTYVGRGAQTKTAEATKTTRATGVTDESLQTEGFGVYAWYTGQTSFGDGSDLESFAVFMNDTKVTKSGDSWTYSPLKYWPNNPGDMVSFVAYAPHIVDAYGNTNYNITVKGKELTYKVTGEVKKQVDLLYSDSDVYNTIDLTKQSVDDKITFYFRHALSKITFTVSAAVDEVQVGNITLDDNTSIFIRKVALIGENDVWADVEDNLTAGGPFYTEGTLDLVTGEWQEVSLALGQRFVFTSTHFVGETALKLNSRNSNVPQQLLNDSSNLMIIPNIGDDRTRFRIYIEYDVVTVDPDAVADYDDSFTVTNRITSNETIEINFLPGRAYRFNLILGMTSTRLDVTVGEWIDGQAGNPATDINEDLPANDNSNQ